MLDNYDAWLVFLDETIEMAKLQTRELAGVRMHEKWASLNWSATGPHDLFNEFKFAAAWNDNITSKRLALEQRRNEVVGAFNGWKVETERKMEGYIALNAKKWIQAQMAYQERQAMARIDTGDDAYQLSVVEKKLEYLAGFLAILKAKADQFAAFKADAKTASLLMNFGHQLGELK